ncbi:MAG TPA: hypothetical protein VLI04_12990 [Nocardioidaceae bacterium]|nr:hypothetical protein [Nocardioidaceae bacterium]
MKRLALLAALAHLALKGGLWPSMRDTPISGDEGAYRDGGLALANALIDLFSGHSPDSAELQSNVVGNGWFMPGPSAVLAPLYMVAPDAGLETMRAYLGALSTVLLLLAAYVVYRRLGTRYALGLLVVPGLMPMWVLFSYTAWGDAVCGLVIVLVLASLVRLAGKLAWGEPWSIWSGIGIGALLASCLYLRSSAFPLVLGCLVLTLLAVLVLPRERLRLKNLAASLVAIATFVILLAPWSVAASKTFDSTVTTTTSLPLSLAFAFGDPDKLCFGPCDDGNTTFFSAVRYSRTVAAVTGQSELDVQQQMADYAMSGLEQQAYAREVGENAARFAFSPNDFLERWWPDVAPSSWEYRAVTWTTWALYGAGLLALALGVIAVVRYPLETQVVSLLVTLFTMACFLQPLLHATSGRYWPIYAPLMGISIGLLAGRHKNEDGRTALVAGQSIAVVTLLTGVLTLGVLTI